MTDAAQPLSDVTQVALHLPVVLLGLAGFVVVLVNMRRLGTLATLLGAAGAVLIAADQIVGVVWVLHLSALTDQPDFDPDHVTSLSNTYTVLDVVLITIGAALALAAIVVRRPPAPPGFAVPGQAGFPIGAPGPGGGFGPSGGFGPGPVPGQF